MKVPAELKGFFDAAMEIVKVPAVQKSFFDAEMVIVKDQPTELVSALKNYQPPSRKWS